MDEDTKNFWFKEIITDLSTGGKLFGSKIAKTYPLSKHAEAYKDAVEFASEGKTLFHPQEE